MKSKRICLVSPGHVASNPRLVKEANALHEAGFQVRVVAGDYMAEVRPLDETILSKAGWSWVQVGLGSKLSYLGRRTLQQTARSLVRTGWIPHLSMAMWAHSAMSAKLAEAAAAKPADLYIAHCLAALPAAAIAAQQHGAKLGFDAEDFHVGELFPTPENAAEIAVRDRLERTLLPQCQHLTAASPKIAEAYNLRYGVLMEPILNVFPLIEAPSAPKPIEKTFQVNGWQENFQSEISPSSPVRIKHSLYWFSQTIGSGRGLESMIQAMGRMETPVHLHLRGFLAAGYSEQLQQLAHEVGATQQIHLHPPASPSEMVQLAAGHDM